MQQKDGGIVLKTIGVQYGDTVIFDGFNADFRQGINVILGKSGSGKTSLLNVITGLVAYKGESLSAKASVVFSEPALAPVSAENNVRLVLRRKDEKTVDEALKIARIESKRKQNVLTLSDGEKQRVALARAFACKRSVMLLDEPFSKLDYGVKRRLYDTLIDYLHSTATTALLVTHDIDEALTIADKIYFLDGRPCSIQLAAELAVPQKTRDIYDERHNAVRKQLQQVFLQESNS